MLLQRVPSSLTRHHNTHSHSLSYFISPSYSESVSIATMSSKKRKEPPTDEGQSILRRYTAARSDSTRLPANNNPASSMCQNGLTWRFIRRPRPFLSIKPLSVQLLSSYMKLVSAVPIKPRPDTSRLKRMRRWSKYWFATCTKMTWIFLSAIGN